MIEANNKPLQVLQVCASLSRGGVETWLMDILRNTSRDEFQIDVCLTGALQGPYEEEFKRLGGAVLRCPIRKNLLAFSSEFKKLLRKQNYDIVHSHLYYFSGFILRLAAEAGVHRRIAHIHPVEDLKRRQFFRDLYAWWMKKWLQRYGTSFVGPTKASLEGFWGPCWRDDQTKRVIYNGIRTDRFVQPVDRTKVRRELGIAASAKIVLNVSRFSTHKRHKFLLEVAEFVLTQRRDVCFLLIGAGRLRVMIKELVRRKGLAEHFRFISGLPSIDSYWLASDVFAFPSCNEGFGITVIEAAAAGLKVIAQDIPGVREAATACPDAILLPLETTAEKWSQTLLNVLEQPRMPESQRQMLLEQFPFTIEDSIKKLRDVYYV